MQVQESDRISKLPPYPFAKLRKRIAEKRAEGANIINLGIGDPDQPTPDTVVQELIRSIQDVQDPNRHRYGCDAPVQDAVRAVQDFYKRRYNVTLTADQICMTSGSKDAIVQLCMGILNPGDLGIVPCPGYPTYNIGHVFASAHTHRVPLRKSNQFLLDVNELPAEVKRLAKIIWLNYPNNPTTALANLDYFKQMVDFAHENNIILCHDSAYSENTYDGYAAPSILQIPGAEEVAVEFFSLSKAFNMTGWRIGMVVGNKQAVSALRKVKENSDNGTLRAIQFAAVKALDSSEIIFQNINAIYKHRRDMVVKTLRENGWEVDSPKASIYVWAPVPEKFKGDSGAFADSLLEQSGVVVTPGRAFGEFGEGFYRISLTYPDDIIQEALSRIKKLAHK